MYVVHEAVKQRALISRCQAGKAAGLTHVWEALPSF